MSGTKRLQRLLQIITLLCSGRTHNANQIADHCKISRRTVFRDIAVLQESGIPLAYDESKLGYYVPGKSPIHVTSLNEEELSSLLILSWEMGSRRPELPIWSTARSAALKLSNQLPERGRQRVLNLANSVLLRIEVPDFSLKSHEIYSLIQTAVAERKQVKITYKSLYEQGQIETIVSPYRLLFNRRSWYLIGRSSMHRTIRTFKLGRIDSVNLLNSTYTVPSRFNLERVLGLAWDMIRVPNEKHDVILQFRALVATNVAEIQWHQTQSIKWNDDGSMEYRVQVEGLEEISWWIMGYGDQCQVISPPKLKTMIEERARRTWEQYQVSGLDQP